MSRRKYYQYEKVFKGVANHRRVEILFMLLKHPGLTTEEIVEKLDINYQTGAHHIQKTVRAGLVESYKEGKFTKHRLSSVGHSIITLLIM